MTTSVVRLRSLCLRLSAIGGIAVGGLSAGAAPLPARVVEISTTPVADLVVLEAGFDLGLRLGMVAQVIRGDTLVGQVMIVDLRSTVSSALILSLSAQGAIRPGDLAVLKIFKSQTS